MKILIAAFCALLLICTSCSSTDIDSHPILVKKLIWRNENIGDVETLRYNYQGNKIVSIIYSNDSDDEVNNDNNSFFTYQGNLISKVEFRGFSGTYRYRTFQYDSNDRLIISTTFYAIGDRVEDIQTYVYNPDGTVSGAGYFNSISPANLYATSKAYYDNGDVIRVESDYDGGTTTTYTYDDANTIGKNILGWDKIPFIGAHYWYRSGSAHNITGASYQGSESTTYTYNSDNFPLVAKEYRSNGDLRATIEYYYE